LGVRFALAVSACAGNSKRSLGRRKDIKQINASYVDLGQCVIVRSRGARGSSQHAASGKL